MKWDYKSRRIIYDTLVDEFGPLKEWKNKTPGDKYYKEIIKNLSETLGCTTGAIQQQIAYMSFFGQHGFIKAPIIIKEFRDSGHICNWIRNVGAALDSKFITPKDVMMFYDGFSPEQQD